MIKLANIWNGKSKIMASFALIRRSRFVVSILLGIGYRPCIYTETLISSQLSTTIYQLSLYINLLTNLLIF